MKRVLLFLVVAVVAVSCKNTWNQEDKDAFYQACTEEHMRTGVTKEQAKTFCDCVFGQMEKKYPNEEDALEHIDVLAKDTDLVRCNFDTARAR
jgi:hypothetical protein